MKKMPTNCLRRGLLLGGLVVATSGLFAQTDMDGITMAKNNLCVGFQYTYSSWEDYWEGKLKRNNLNLGTVSTQMIGFMGSYGVTDKINVQFGAPYVKTKATAGTLHGVDGIQDLSLSVKYLALKKGLGNGTLKTFGVVGFSTPLTNYVADFQPLAIGLKSTNLTLRAIGDYEMNRFFVTLAAAYVFRSNVEIDRDSYFDTELHMTNKVDMPNQYNYQAHIGYRGKVVGAEAVFSRMQTIGGFDITRNNMPFPSNQMNASVAAVMVKCNPKALPGLSVNAGSSYVVDGRNVGQSLAFTGGVFYIFDFNKKSKK